ncbi:MAG: OsmC family protein, partial [Acidobacteriaceae bacterium]
MEVHVEHVGAVQFEIKARQHTIACDQPEALGGFDEGMTPPELLLSALASCAAYYAVAYLKKKGFAAPGTRVSVSADKVQNAARMDNFKIALSVPIDLSEENRAGLEQAVHHCLIHNTLLHPPTIGLTIHESV